LLFFSVFNGFSLSTVKDKQEFAGGSGTASDPWLTETAEYLNNEFLKKIIKKPNHEKIETFTISFY